MSIFEGEGEGGRVAFRASSPTGTVPAIELDDGRALAESNAIPLCLADGTRYRRSRASPMQPYSIDPHWAGSPAGRFPPRRPRNRR